MGAAVYALFAAAALIIGIVEGAWMKSASLKRAERAVVRKHGHHRQHGPEIYYLMDPELDHKKDVRDCVHRAMGHVSNASCIRFVNTGDNSPPPDRPFVIFSVNLQAHHCSANVGVEPGRQTFIRLGEKCGVQTGRCLREIMKALGFEAEHERPDRDSFVRIHMGNVRQGDEVEFTKAQKEKNVELLTPYDLSSIMHPLPHEHSRNGEPTVGAKDNLVKDSVGWAIRRHDLLSHRDRLALNAVFKCAAQCTMQLVCEHGGYMDESCSCKCPYGFTGKTCSELSMSHHFNLENCGEVRAEASGSLASPNFPERYGHGVFCQWLLKAPEPWQWIEFEVTELDLEYEDVVPPDTCHDRLFLRPHGTDVVTKSVSCLPNDVELLRGSVHETQYPWMLVEFRSYHWGFHHHRGFNLTYRLVGLPPKTEDFNVAGMVSDGWTSNSSKLHCYTCQSMQECNQTVDELKTQRCKTGFVCGSARNEYGLVEWRGCREVEACRSERATCFSDGTGHCLTCCARGYCNAAASPASLLPLLPLVLTLLFSSPSFLSSPSSLFS